METNLFDVTHGWKGSPDNTGRSATLEERNAYLRWLAAHRGVYIEGCTFSDEGVHRKVRGESVLVLAMPGYGAQPAAIMETLGDNGEVIRCTTCLLYTSPSPRDRTRSRMPSSA